MERPPSRPPILLTRPTHEWISKVNLRHLEFTRLELSTEQSDAVRRSFEVEFVRSALALADIVATDAELARVAVSSAPGATTSTRRPIAGLLEALRMVDVEARGEGRGARLTPDLLLKVNASIGGEGRLRTSAGPTNRLPRPMPAEQLAVAIGTACLWYAAESFVELHPVEQASIVQLRLLELYPFETANEGTALVAASLFTLRSGLPPVVIGPADAYRAAVDEGLRMNTKPMVELTAESIERSLSETIRLVSQR